MVCLRPHEIKNKHANVIVRTRDEVNRMMDINYTGVMMTATSAARQMFKYKIHGSMCFIASMSGSIANKGLLSPVSKPRSSPFSYD